MCVYCLNSSAQNPTKKISWWKEVAGTEPASQGEVQKTESGIPKSWAGASLQSTFIAFKSMPMETSLLAPGPAQWATAFADGQVLKDAGGEGRLTPLDSLSWLRERQKADAQSLRSSGKGVRTSVCGLHFITQLGWGELCPTFASHPCWESPGAASER